MTLRLYPSTDLLTVSRRMDRLVDEFFGNGGASAAQDGGGVPTYNPPVDIRETDGEYVLTAAVPGFAPEHVDLTFDEGVLEISAKAQPLEKDGRWIRQERPWGNFVRRLELPQQIDAAKIAASFENGLLTVTIPKVGKPQPVKIPVGKTTLES